ncbi:hypothetical protein [Acetobacterium bakii]|uniref:hypothetical protein n=1 Tax=Acetobacterium bakii TaxID=52689 RepID=UPI001364D980|nr:hypothetical protein [Acetobacterium bakii]
MIMVNRCRLHDRTGSGLFAMMPTTDVTIVTGTYFLFVGKPVMVTMINRCLLDDRIG